MFTPMTVRPQLQNVGEVQQALQRAYPPLLRDAGISGRVMVWFFIDEEGRVARTQLHESSGHEAFDDAALRVAEVLKFSPAYNRDQRVPVWNSIPITFEVGSAPPSPETSDLSAAPTFTPMAARPDPARRPSLLQALQLTHPQELPGGAPPRLPLLDR
jgi:TonB family protein